MLLSVHLPKRLRDPVGPHLSPGIRSQCRAGRPRRYITRPAIAERRLSIANNGNVVIALKTPYDDGATGTPSLMWYSVPWNSWGAWQRWSEAGRTQTTGQPHAVSWCVLAGRPSAGRPSAGRPSAQQQTARVRCSAETRRRTREPETKGLHDDLGTAPQACVRRGGHPHRY